MSLKESNRAQSIQRALEMIGTLKSKMESGLRRGNQIEEQLKRQISQDLKKLELLNPGIYKANAMDSAPSNYIEFVTLKDNTYDVDENLAEQPEQQQDDGLYKSPNLLEVFSVLILDFLSRFKPQQYEEVFNRFLTLDLSRYESTDAFLKKHNIDKEKLRKSMTVYRGLIEKNSAEVEAKDSEFLKQCLETMVKYLTIETAQQDMNDELVQFLESGHYMSESLRNNLSQTLAKVFGLSLDWQSLGIDSKLTFGSGQGKLIIYVCQNGFQGSIANSSQLSPYRKIK